MSAPDSTATAICVGIDVAKDTLEVALGEQVATLCVANSPDGFDADATG